MKSKIKELRNKHGISQTELAKAVKTTKRTIYAIEVENSDMRISLASKLASYFMCSIDELYDFEDDIPADVALHRLRVLPQTYQLSLHTPAALNFVDELNVLYKQLKKGRWTQNWIKRKIISQEQ